MRVIRVIPGIRVQEAGAEGAVGTTAHRTKGPRVIRGREITPMEEIHKM